jgi:L-lactate dehydrogenase complex protein LldE
MMTHKPVSLFIQCLVDAMYPQVGEAMVAVFERLGVPLLFPENQTCCGQPAFNSGYRREAAAAAKHFIEIFDAAEGIVCPSGSCVHMVRHHYPELFPEDDYWRQRAIAVGQKTFEFTEYLVDQLQVTELAAGYHGKVTYHDSCHLSRGLRISSQPRELLTKVTGLELVEMVDSDTCCGFGGTFSVNYPDISIAMVDDKIANILATGADTVTGCDISCLMNIEGRLKRRKENIKVLHIAEILAATEGRS